MNPGNFQVPPAGDHRVGIVVGVAVPETEQAGIFNRFDTFLSQLPKSAFENGEPKGRLLDDGGRNAFAQLVASLPGVLVCPSMLDLTSLSGTSNADAREPVLRRLNSQLGAFKHESMPDEVANLVATIEEMSAQQFLRLLGWALCVNRAIRDSIILHSDEEHRSSWESLRFEIDRAEQGSARREEKVFSIMLPTWLTSWSLKKPLLLIEELHTTDHPLVKNWDRKEGLDLGNMFRNNVHYVSSASSKGIQLADLIASVVRRAVCGVVRPFDLRNYGLVMTKQSASPQTPVACSASAKAKPKMWNAVIWV
ncbi:hypothetical protein AYO40_01325 [Planctomycetaceae bacterium SCGC AG-212-D15]|nr:hypothetical protein AYO40_01325 [Planctomycetaceae bacterium SCGC AG-212-D15]